MARTTVDLDEQLVERAMQRYRLPTKTAAVNFALKALAGDPMTLQEALALEGTGWGPGPEVLRDDVP
jgi:Arc/MetJ family transcription regulator